MKKYGFQIFVLILFVALGSSLLKYEPQGVHSWAQSDRYSVAYHYLDEVNFFKARTHTLTSNDGRVGVEFPIVQYTAARLASLTVRDYLPYIYRILTGIIFAFGCYKFLLVFPFTVHLKSFLYLLLISPIVLFYQFNFLPDVAALGILFWSLSFLVKFQNNGTLSNMSLALLLGALATLTKTSCGIYLIALVAVFAFKFKQYKPFEIVKMGGLILALVILIISYDYYAFHKVNQDYWSVVFMSSTNTIGSWQELVSVWKNSQVWFGDYLSSAQYILLVVVIVALWVRRKSVRIFSMKTSVVFGWISLTGVLSFSLLFGKQYSNHDYYIICTFYPLFAWFLVNSLNQLSNRGWLYRGIVIPIIFVLGVYHFVEIQDNAQARMGEYYWAQDRAIINETHWMKDSFKELRDANVSSNARIFVLYEFGPNSCLVGFNRRGKVFNHEEMERETKDHLNYWKDRINPEYFIIRSHWITHLEKDQPSWLEGSDLIFEKEVPIPESTDSYMLYKFKQS